MEDVKLKICIGCHVPKPLTDFYTKGKTRPNDYQSFCKKCMQEKYTVWKKQKDNWRWVRKWEKAWRKRNPGRSSCNYWEQLQLVEEHLNAHPCVDCGEDDMDVLDFDHVRGEKLFTIKRMLWLGVPTELLVTEIAKCDIRCANCHRKRHIRKRTWDDIR